MRLAALLLLAAALPAQASTCIVGPIADEFATRCHPAPASDPAAMASPPREVASATLRPRARPDHLALGDTASSSSPSAAQDPLLSPQATLFWDVV